MDLLARFVGIMMVFVMYIAVSAEGVAYDAACNVDADCTEANNVCTTSKCACSTDSYRKGGKECATKIALAGTCTATPTGQCADSYAECHATNLCKCTSNYFANKNAACASQIGLDSTCDGKDSAKDQCSVADTECRADGGGSKCLCKATHFSDGSACVLKVTGLDKKCTGTVSATDQCSTAGTECRDDGAGSKCLCKTTHYTDGGACVLRKKPDEEGCAADQCVTHATCNTGSSPTKCECEAGYTATPTATPTMCSRVVKVTTLPYMYVIPILVSMIFIIR